MPRSELWKYFVKTKEGGECKLCKLSIKSLGTTTNLKRHLERRHPTILTNPKSTSQNNMKVKINEQSLRESLPSTSKYVPASNLQHLPSTSKYVPASNLQPRIDNTLLQMESFKSSGKKADQITNAIIYMIAKDDLPLSTTEKEGFQFLLKTAVPLYKAPSQKTIASLIEQKYDVLSLFVKERLSTISNITLTTDIWTETMNTKGFLGLTCHFEENKKLQGVTIGVTELNQNHTAKYLEECLRNIMSDWNISVEKVTAIVTDNGSNIVKLSNDIFGKNRHLPCFAHTLDLVASKILEDVNEVKLVVSAVKAIVTFSKQSVVVADELRKAQPQDNVLKLCQSVPTRWNSTYYMLERFTKLYEYIVPIIIKKPKSPPMISASDMELIHEVLQILAPIEQVSKEICGEKYVTASKVIPLVNCLTQHITGYNPESDTGKQFKTIVVREIEKRFGAIEQNNMLGISTIMDPRFKRLHFQQPLACSKIVNIINKHCEAQNQLSREERLSEPDDSAVEKKVGLWQVHESLAKKSKLDHEVQDLVGGLNADFKIYLNQPLIDLKSDPLEYWNSGSQNKILKELANKYLSIVATSVSSERLFSKAGIIMSPSRNRLSGKRLTQLLFLKSLDKEDWHL